MPHASHRFTLEFHAADGRELLQRPVEPDWEPACEWTQLAAWRRAGAVFALPIDSAIIEPLAHATRGLPYTRGFRVTLVAPEGGRASADFGPEYFRRQARAIARELVDAGQLPDSESFRFQLFAYPIASAPRAMMAPAFAIAEETSGPAPHRVMLRTLFQVAEPRGEQTADDLPVFVPADVLAETAALTAAAGPVETGGILLGHLVRDAERAELGVVITAQIPARQAEGEANKLTFTAATWTAVRATIALRRSDEIYCGWWHSHCGSKYWCKPECPLERRRTCAFAQDFFSEEDACLHRTVFGKAFHVALVVTNTDDGLRHALFAWRAGGIAQRGFHALRRNPAATATAAPPPPEISHASPCS